MRKDVIVRANSFSRGTIDTNKCMDTEIYIEHTETQGDTHQHVDTEIHLIL